MPADISSSMAFGHILNALLGIPSACSRVAALPGGDEALPCSGLSVTRIHVLCVNLSCFLLLHLLCAGILQAGHSGMIIFCSTKCTIREGDVLNGNVLISKNHVELFKSTNLGLSST